MNLTHARKRPPATYSGASRSSTYAKQKALHEAAVGSTKISAFFCQLKQNNRANAPSPSAEPASLSHPGHPPSFQDGSSINSAIHIDSECSSMSPPPNAEAEPLATQVATQAREMPHASEMPHNASEMPHNASEMPHNASEESLSHWDPTVDNEDMLESVSTFDTLKKLIIEAKKFKSFTSLVHLYAVKSFMELRAKYVDSPQIKNPIMRTSRTVAASIGKSPYFARKIRGLHKYIECFHTLPPTNAGRHHTHPSLLNNEGIVQAVCCYLTVLANGEVRKLC